MSPEKKTKESLRYSPEFRKPDQNELTSSYKKKIENIS